MIDGSAPGLCCPRCRRRLESGPTELRCGSCDVGYPVIAGIPDLRVCADPYLDVESDRAKARALAARAPHTDFAGLVRQYWEMTPTTSAAAAERYLEYALRGEARGQSALELAGCRAGRLLDLGTGTGGVLATADEFAERTGADVALRWLIIAAKHLEERGRTASLVCACADHLPFSDGGFDCLIGLDLLAHCADPPAVLAESARVLRPSGVSAFTVANRYSLLGDPHTGLVGAGFLPRRWQARYVTWRARRFDSHIRPLGSAEAARMARRSFHSVTITLPRIAPGEQALLHPRDRRKARAYEQLRRLGPVRPLLVAFGPAFVLRCAAPATKASA